MATAETDVDSLLKSADELIAQPSGTTDVDQLLNQADEVLGSVPDADQQEKAIRPDVSKAESFLRGASQGATFNLGDEASAVFETTLGALESVLRGKNAFGQQGTLEGLKNILSNYDKSLNDIRSQNQKALEANPKAFIAGEVGGSLVTSPGASAGVVGLLKGARAAKGASDLAKVTNAVSKTGVLGREAVAQSVGMGGKFVKTASNIAKTGAAEAAVAGFGGAEGGLEERLKGAAIAGTTGFVAGKALEKAGSAFSKAAESEFVSQVRAAVSDKIDSVVDSLADLTGNFALRSIKASGAGIREMRRLNRFDKIGQLGQDLVNPPELGGKQLKKAIGFKSLNKTKEIIDENLDAVNNYADKFVTTFDTAFEEAVKKGLPKDEAEKFFKIEADDFIKEARDAINTKFRASADKPFKKELQDSLDDFAADWAGKKMSISEAIAERQGFQRRVNFFKSRSATTPGQAAGPVENAFDDLQKLLNKKIDSKSDEVIGKYFPDKAGTFKRIRQLQGNFIDASRITQDALDRKAANNMFSLTNVILGSAGFGASAATGDSAIESGIKGLALVGLAKGAGYSAPRLLASLANVGRKTAGSQPVKATADVLSKGLAVGANRVANGLKKNFNKLGKFGEPLKEASKRGTPSLLATHLILFNTSDDYRRQVEDLDEVE